MEVAFAYPTLVTRHPNAPFSLSDPSLDGRLALMSVAVEARRRRFVQEHSPPRIPWISIEQECGKLRFQGLAALFLQSYNDFLQVTRREQGASRWRGKKCIGEHGKRRSTCPGMLWLFICDQSVPGFP